MLFHFFSKGLFEMSPALEWKLKFTAAHISVPFCTLHSASFLTFPVDKIENVHKTHCSKSLPIKLGTRYQILAAVSPLAQRGKY